MKKHSVYISLFIIVIALITSCKKPEGQGGRATIQGKLLIRNYNSGFTILQDTFYVAGENVFIMYGNETTVGDNVKTAPDGSFKFEYLRKGKYKVFVISKDKQKPTFTGTISVVKSVEITTNKQTVDVGDIVAYD
ncbi:MAG: hypothetical protein H7331_00340 [Bacteroidia bacterium]|nr:hypothetical protein [Bacteroidia bacterium]